MKTFKLYIAMLVAVLMLGLNFAQAQTTHKGWSKKGKGAAIGAGSGAVVGAVIAGKGHRGKGAIIGGAAGAVGGALIGRHKDKKTDPARYSAYKN